MELSRRLDRAPARLLCCITGLGNQYVVIRFSWFSVVIAKRFPCCASFLFGRFTVPIRAGQLFSLVFIVTNGVMFAHHGIPQTGLVANDSH
jgi:hypothetical protein